MRRSLDILALGFAALALWSSPAAAEIAVGAARLVVADVSARTALASRKLATADEVRYQELIATERSSAAVIQFVDGTELAIGEQARVRLDEFVFDPGAAGRLDLSLEFGALRFSTGSMAKPAYTLATPCAARSSTSRSMATAPPTWWCATARWRFAAATARAGRSPPARPSPSAPPASRPSRALPRLPRWAP